MNISNVTKALQAQIENDPDVSQFMNQKVVRDDIINFDPNRTPWIGVYKGTVDYEPRTLGYNSFEATPKPRVIVQATSYKSGDDCGELLDGYVDKVMDAIKKDKTIDGTIDMVTGFSVEYFYEETEMETMYFQSAIITLNLTVDDQ